jgi:hypothetical protein
MKKKPWVPFVVAAVLAFPACTNRQGETEADVVVSVDITLQPGFIDVSVVAPIQIQTMVLTSHLKNPAQTDPQGFADTLCESYSVHYHRTDGGTRVPSDKTFGCGVRIPSTGASTLRNFPILAASDIQAAPFDQLLPFNGGVDRETGKTEIQMAFDLTFFGHTVAGQRVQSTTATGILLFSSSAVTPLRHRTSVR